MPCLFVIAGEASGDTHGAGLLAALKKRRPDLEVHGLGGPKMRAVAGAGVEDWIAEAGVVGLWEVIRHYPWFRKKFDEQLGRIAALEPDAVILIDYPGFNLRLAKALRAAMPQLKIIYYISPQVWAWHGGRIPKMARWLDLMLCIFPFEVDLYNASGLETIFTGHPLVDHLGAKKIIAPREPNVVGLFPGSREREVARLFPMMLEAGRLLREQRRDLIFLAAAASEPLAAMMRSLAGRLGWCEIECGTAHALMQRAAVGVIASGTASLEAAFFGLPYCLVYKVSWPTYFVGRAVVQVPFLGIANILAGREVVREFIQHLATPKNVATEIMRLLSDEQARRQMQDQLAEVVSGLGDGGAYERAADAVWGATRLSRS
ncbi:MAG: lipid-A-disaccharide synthase [Verrucomicrobiales bacterium]